MTIRAKTSALLAAIVIVTLAVTGVLYVRFLEQSLENSIFAGLDSVSESASDAVSRSLDGSLRDVQAIAACLPRKALAEKDTHVAEESLKAFSEMFPQFENGMFLLDANGKLWADYPAHPEVRGQSFAYREYFQRTLSEQRGVIGTPYRSARSNELVLTFTAPLWGQNWEIEGVLACSEKLLNPNALGGIRNTKIGRSGYVYIYDSSRLMVLHPQDERILRRDVPPKANKLFDAAINGFRGVGETVNSKGIPMLVSFRQIRGTDWILGAQQPKSEALAPVKDAENRIIAGALIASSLAVLIGLLVIRSITLPLQRLREAVAQLASSMKAHENAYFIGNENLSGNSGSLKPVDEIDELRRSFSDMSITLDHTMALLRDSAADWERTFNSVKDFIFILDKDYRIVRMNRSAAEVMRISPGQAVGRNCFEVINGTSDPPHFCPNPEALSTVIESGEVIEIRCFGKIMEMMKTPLLDGKGETYGSVITMRDITERKNMEEELHRMKEYLENVIENAVDGIGIVNRRGFFVVWNKRAETIFGFSSDEMENRHFSSVYADRDEMERLLATLKKDGVVREFEASMLRKDGSSMPMELSINLLRNGNERVVGSVCLARDLREKKLLESRLMHAAKMEAVGTLAGGIAHDFNNLLQAVQGYAELLCYGKTEKDPYYVELQEIIRAAKRGGDLTRQLLTFSRKVESVLRPIDLNFEIQQTLNLLKRTIPKMISIELHVQEDLKPVNGDPAQIEQILMNLAVNSKDAMPEGGKLMIETKSVILGEDFCRLHAEVIPGEYVSFCITDTGCGMDEETLEHIFDPFYTTKELGSGTGLGLSMVYGIVKSHGGHIECLSSQGRGTTFNIYLPPTDTMDEPLKSSIVPDLPPGNETILLVDDEDFIRDLASQILTRYGYKVITATDGESALRAYRGMDRIDLVILDLIMPGMGGRQCLAKLIESDPNAKVIIASGHSADSTITEIISSKARHFISKPYQLKDLLMSVRGVLDEQLPPG